MCRRWENVAFCDPPSANCFWSRRPDHQQYMCFSVATDQFIYLSEPQFFPLLSSCGCSTPTRSSTLELMAPWVSVIWSRVRQQILRSISTYILEYTLEFCHNPGAHSERWRLHLIIQNLPFGESRQSWLGRAVALPRFLQLLRPF